MLVPTWVPTSILKGERGEVGISVSGLVCGGMDTARIGLQQGLGEFVK